MLRTTISSVHATNNISSKALNVFTVCALKPFNPLSGVILPATIVYSGVFVVNGFA